MKKVINIIVFIICIVLPSVNVAANEISVQWWRIYKRRAFSKIIAMQIKKAAGSLLINSEVFDVYTGKGIEEGKKSLAYSLTFGSNDRTLTDEEINAILENIIDKLSKIGEVRNK